MKYKNLLASAAGKAENIICMGLDPVISALPPEGNSVEDQLTGFFEKMLSGMVSRGLSPAAFKPNLGFWSCLDCPREGSFSGSKALASVLDMIEDFFPGIPVILDYKRGDIARSSANYASEGFECWGCHSITAAPWMGEDSVTPFLEAAEASGGGVYLLNRTSNPGGRDFQNIRTGEEGRPMFMVTAEKIREWSERYPGTGAVAGATSSEELFLLAEFYAVPEVPLLIPGVGRQGGSAGEVIGILEKSGYPVKYARINSSSGLTHPWAAAGTGPGENWVASCCDALERLIEETC